MNRFDYVRYDDEAATLQALFKHTFQHIELLVDSKIQEGRAKSLVMTKLEEAYMWIGKAIRDEQVEKRNAELQETRSDG